MKIKAFILGLLLIAFLGGINFAANSEVKVSLIYHGQSCFTLVSPSGKTVVIDPPAQLGYKVPEGPVDAVTVSHEHFDHNNVAAVKSKQALRGLKTGGMDWNNVNATIGDKRTRNFLRDAGKAAAQTAAVTKDAPPRKRVRPRAAPPARARDTSSSSAPSSPSRSAGHRASRRRESRFRRAKRRSRSPQRPRAAPG